MQSDSFRPYTTVPSLSAVNRVKNQAENELLDIIHELEQKGVQILENNVKILVYEDRVEATGTLVLIEPIGEGIQTLPENTQIDEIGETDEYNGNND